MLAPSAAVAHTMWPRRTREQAHPVLRQLLGVRGRVERLHHAVPAPGGDGDAGRLARAARVECGRPEVGQGPRADGPPGAGQDVDGAQVDGHQHAEARAQRVRVHVRRLGRASLSLMSQEQLMGAADGPRLPVP